jgi:hypothetical protein
MACCCHSNCRLLRMMDVVFGLSDGREHAFICALQQQQQSRLPSASRKEQSTCRRACNTCTAPRKHKDDELEVKAGRRLLQFFSQLIGIGLSLTFTIAIDSEVISCV